MSKSMNNSKLRNTKLVRGFTLIESAIAISVLMVGLLAVLQFFPFAIKIIGDSQQLTVASNLVVAKLEEMSSLDYDLISVGTIEAKQALSGDTSSFLADYQRQTVVEYVDANLNSSQTDLGLKKITTTVYWLSPVGLNEKSTSGSTLLADF